MRWCEIQAATQRKPTNNQSSAPLEKKNTSGAGATRKRSSHGRALRYDALPAALVDLTKRGLLDTLGVCIGAGTLAPESKIVAGTVCDFGGKPEK